MIEPSVGFVNADKTAPYSAWDQELSVYFSR